VGGGSDLVSGANRKGGIKSGIGAFEASNIGRTEHGSSFYVSSAPVRVWPYGAYYRRNHGIIVVQGRIWFAIHIWDSPQLVWFSHFVEFTNLSPFLRHGAVIEEFKAYPQSEHCGQCCGRTVYGSPRSNVVPPKRDALWHLPYCGALALRLANGGSSRL
jgi:hypothetical protein